MTPIGFYYSLFHLGVSILFLDYSMNIDNLHKLKHKSLQNFVESKFIQRKIISDIYLKQLKRFQIYREYANYKFANKFDPKNYKLIARSSFQKLEPVFDICIDFINLIQKEFPNNWHEPINTIIGDDISSDFSRQYLSFYVDKKVNEYLIRKQIAT